MNSEENKHQMKTSYQISVPVLSPVEAFWNAKMASKFRTILTIELSKEFWHNSQYYLFSKQNSWTLAQLLKEKITQPFKLYWEKNLRFFNKVNNAIISNNPPETHPKKRTHKKVAIVPVPLVFKKPAWQSKENAWIE